MADYFKYKNSNFRFTEVGEIKYNPDNLKITYIFKGGRELEVAYESQSDYDNAITEINNASGGGGGSGGTLIINSTSESYVEGTTLYIR